MVPLLATLLSPGSVWSRNADPPSRPKLTMLARPATFDCSWNPQSAGEFGKVQVHSAPAAGVVPVVFTATGDTVQPE